MIHYTIRHYVTSEAGDTDAAGDAETTTVHGDDALCVWVDSDPATAPPDEIYEVSGDGWRWRADGDDWIEHPAPLSNHADSPDAITRLTPWETTITDGVTR